MDLDHRRAFARLVSEINYQSQNLKTNLMKSRMNKSHFSLTPGFSPVIEGENRKTVSTVLPRGKAVETARTCLNSIHPAQAGC